MSISQNFPEEGPTLNLNFAGSKVLDPRITFSRSSSSGDATYMDVNGLIVTAAADEPRFDHRYVNGEVESLGLLVEESRINQIRNNTMIGASIGTPPTNWTPINRSGLTWSITGTGIDAGVYYVDIRLSGTSNATSSPTLTFESGSQISASNGQTWSTSCFIKLVSGTTNNITQIILAHDERSGTYLTGGNSTNFLSSINSSTTNIFSSCRYSFTRTNTNASTTFLHPYLLVTPTNGAVIDMTLRIGMPQTELGAFITSVIPTSGSTKTRTKDRAVIEGTNFTDIFDTNFESFSMFVNYDNLGITTGTNHAVVIFWGESVGYNDRIEFYKDDAAPYHIETRAFGGGSGVFSNGNLSAGSTAATQKLAMSWSVPDYSDQPSRRWAFSFNGESVDVVNDGSGSTIPAVTRVGFGINPTRTDFHGKRITFKQITLYSNALTDSQLQNLTK